MTELKSLPHLVASFDDESFEESSALFSLLNDDIIRLLPLEAELAKLFINSWRYLQFAISNQFYSIALDNGLDFYKIFHAITHNYPRTSSFPTPGFTAGPCLFKDTMQLANFSNNSFFIGHAGMLVNEGLPNTIINNLKKKYDLTKMSTGILGMAFKKDIDDPRDSLSYKLRKLLELESASVLCSDPFIKGEGFVGAEELVQRSDVIVIGTPHTAYTGLLIGPDKILVDPWNFFSRGGMF